MLTACWNPWTAPTSCWVHERVLTACFHATGRPSAPWGFWTAPTERSVSAWAPAASTGPCPESPSCRNGRCCQSSRGATKSVWYGDARRDCETAVEKTAENALMCLQSASTDGRRRALASMAVGTPRPAWASPHECRYAP